MPDPCTCQLCGPCLLAVQQKGRNDYAQQETPAEFSPTEPAPYRSLALPGGVIVYVLGSIDNKPNQISIFSGINGWHIRDIPATRFINPVMVGAGAGKLAVVERLPDYDMIRITDEYAGGGSASYDINGFPLASVNFSALKDFRQVLVPRGSRVSGLKILSNGMLIAGLSSGDNSFRYLKALTDALPVTLVAGDPTIVGGPFDATTPYEGIQQLPAPFDTIGNPTGCMALFDANGGQRMFEVFAVAQDSTLGASVVLFDFVQNKVAGHFGLPEGGSAISMHQSGEIINVLFNTGTTTEIIRASVAQQTYFMAGQRSAITVPESTEFPVFHTFSPQDDPSFANVVQPTIDDLVGYLSFAGLLNKNSNYFGQNTAVSGNNVYTTAGVFLGTVQSLIILLLSGGSIDASDPAAPLVQKSHLTVTPDGPFTQITPASNSITEMDGRLPTTTVYKTQFGPTTDLGTSYPAQVVPSTSFNPIYLEGTEDTIAELYAKNDPATGKIDITKAIFLLMHGSHYDWLSRGGFTYGCTTGGTTVAQTNGIVGVSIATDASGELGQHKDLPDLKVVLYDSLTGLVIYRQPKPQGFTIFGGQYADLSLVDSNVRKSQCGLNVDAEASIFDGIDRNDPDPVPPALGTGYPVMASSEVPVDAWNTSDTDLNFPWQLFSRRTQGITSTKSTPSGGAQYVTRVTPKLSSWTYQNPQGDDILPWWRTGAEELANPTQTSTNGNGQVFYPTLGGEPSPHTFIANSLGGFFNLGLLQVASTGVSPYEVIPIAQSLSAAINPSPSIQTIDPILGGTDEIPAAITPKTPPWQAINVPGDGTNTTRGVVIDPGIRSWVSTEIKLNRDNRLTGGDGQNIWEQPEDAGGNFGLNLGPAYLPAPTTVSPFICSGTGAIPGFVYDGGDFALDGAAGVWEVQVFVNGGPIANAMTQAQANDITYLAPGDMQALLQDALTASGGVDPDVGLHYGKVYFSNEPITSVTIKVQLVNYAYNVIRFGQPLTLQWVASVPSSNPEENSIVGFRPNTVGSEIINGNVITLFSYGADPGFFWGNTSDAACVGNVTFIAPETAKLCASDPDDAVVRNVLAEWTANYSIPEANNPYTALGLAIGTYISAYFEVDLNTGMFNYKINLRQGEGRTQGPGGCV